MTADMMLERIRAANPAKPHAGDYEELFRAIVATPYDPRLARRQTRRITGLRLVLVALILLLLLAGVATATYFALRASDAITFPRGNSRLAVVESAAAGGSPLWQCPDEADWCGDVAGAAWSPDGERLALSLGAIPGGSSSPYVGFHVINPRAGTDQHIPRLATWRRFGCPAPSYLAWSSDGKLLAYTCRELSFGPGGSGNIYTIRPDGTGRRLIPTGPFSGPFRAFSPTWSPDGKRLAFSTGEGPFPTKLHGRWPRTSYRSFVYVIDLDGSHARRVATGSLPDWSPDGKTIAYLAPRCGPAPDNEGRIRLVTPTGRDVTPPTAPCNGIGPAGHPVPAWSPDGQQIAVGTNTALYEMNGNGTDLRRLQRGKFNRVGLGLWGYIRPAWRPKVTGTPKQQHKP